MWLEPKIREERDLGAVEEVGRGRIAVGLRRISLFRWLVPKYVSVGISYSFV